MIFVEVTSSIGFAVVTSSLDGEGVEFSLAIYYRGMLRYISRNYI